MKFPDQKVKTLPTETGKKDNLSMAEIVQAELEDEKRKHPKDFLLRYFNNFTLHFGSTENDDGAYRSESFFGGNWKKTDKAYHEERGVSYTGSIIAGDQTPEEFYRTLDATVQQILSENQVKQLKILAELDHLKDFGKVLEYFIKTDLEFDSQEIQQIVKIMKQKDKTFYKLYEEVVMNGLSSSSIRDALYELLLPVYIKLREMGYKKSDFTK